MIIEADLHVDLPIVVTVDGSLTAIEGRYCEHDFEKVVALGEEISQLDSTIRGRLIVIFCGEVFSEGIALRYGLNSATSLETMRGDFSRMTVGMFRMMSAIVDIWRDLGINAYPIQPATQLRVCNGELRLMADHFLTCLAHQLVPITTCDVALLPDLTIHPLLGNSLAVLLAREVDIARAVLMTDALGSSRASEWSTLPPFVRSSDPGRERAPGHEYMGGATAENLETARALAALGVPTRIINGQVRGTLASVLASLKSPRHEKR